MKTEIPEITHKPHGTKRKAPEIQGEIENSKGDQKSPEDEITSSEDDQKSSEDEKSDSDSDFTNDAMELDDDVDGGVDGPEITRDLIFTGFKHCGDVPCSDSEPCFRHHFRIEHPKMAKKLMDVKRDFLNKKMDEAEKIKEKVALGDSHTLTLCKQKLFATGNIGKRKGYLSFQTFLSSLSVGFSMNLDMRINIFQETSQIANKHEFYEFSDNFRKISEVEKCIGVVSNGRQSAILTERGSVFMADVESQSDSDEIKGILNLKKVDDLEDIKIKKLVINGKCTLALSVEGNVYEKRHQGSCASSFVKRIDLKNISDIAMGEGHGLALDKNGKVIVWGRNEKGQLGLSTVKRELLDPAKVPDLEKIRIRKIAAGGNSSALLSAEGDLYLCGSINGQSTFMEYPDFDIIDVALGASHVAVLNNDGAVLTMGSGDKGQLGHHEDGSIFNKISLDGKKCKAVATGSSHSMALCEGGAVFTWGEGYVGQLGQGDMVSSTTPERVEDFSWENGTKQKTLNEFGEPPRKRRRTNNMV